MCGLAGVAGNGLIKQDIDTFKDILYVSSLRGQDSTGLVVANTNKPHNSHAIFKTEDPSPDFIDMMTYKGGPFTIQGQNLMMGHCRWGTVGEKSLANAHPFEFSQIIGMHNGTLEDLKYLYTGKTDSEAMFEDMNNRGIKPVLEGLDWRSAFAITVYDKKTRRLYMARNSQRTLYVGINKSAGVIYWASEDTMLYLAAKRNKIELDVYYLRKDTLYEIDVNDIKLGVKSPWKTIDLKLDAWEPVDLTNYTKSVKKKRQISLENDPMWRDDDIPWVEYMK